MLKQVFELIEKTKGFNLAEASVLEMFAGNGMRTTTQYDDMVGHLTLWEINPAHKKELEESFEDAEVVITDSYEAIKKVKARFDIVLMDNPIVAMKNIENFGLFPFVFKALKPHGFLIFNAVSNINLYGAYNHMERTNRKKVDKARMEFFNHAKTKIPQHKITDKFHALAKKAGFEVISTHWERRNPAVSWFMEELKRPKKKPPTKKETIGERIEKDKKKTIAKK